MLRVALAQINTTVGDLAGNRAKILAYCQKARQSQADIVLFPEMAITGYPPEDLLFKEHFVRDNLKSLRAIVRQVRGITAVIGFADKTSGKIYNAAAVVGSGKLLGVYHKHELPNYGVFDEKRYFMPGREVPLFSMGGIRLGLSICEDIWVDASAVNREYQRRKVQVIFNISSSPFDFEKWERRKKMLIRRARQTGAYVCYVNLVGGQDELVFDGGSAVINPQGQVVAAGKHFVEDLVIMDLPFANSRRTGATKKQGVPLPQFYPEEQREVLSSEISPRQSPVERIFHALVLGTRDYVYKNGFQKVVIGLSGGIDSSLVAVIAREAVGQDNVIGISMPSPFNSPETRSDARVLAENLAIRFIEIPISGIFASYQEILAREFSNLPFGVAEENLQARIRGNLLMTFSNKFGWLVLTTGNKSEVAVGYCTLYGDMSGGFAVIKDVSKTQVFEMARFVNQKFGPLIPETILTRAPSAELREGQKDQDTLPPYAVLDKLIKDYVEEHRSIKKMISPDADIHLVKRVIGMVDHSEYKRRQAPPGVKITQRAFGKDWRLPITHKYKED